MNKWTEDQVLEFLSAAGFRSLKPAFAKNNIDGELLSRLTRATLKTEIGIASLGVREKLIKVCVPPLLFWFLFCFVLFLQLCSFS